MKNLKPIFNDLSHKHPAYRQAGTAATVWRGICLGHRLPQQAVMAKQAKVGLEDKLVS